jgi:hypothetical protein
MANLKSDDMESFLEMPLIDCTKHADMIDAIVGDTVGLLAATVGLKDGAAEGAPVKADEGAGIAFGDEGRVICAPPAKLTAAFANARPTIFVVLS